MKEEAFKKLMQESLLKTSEDFTDGLMEKIEPQKAAYRFPQKFKAVLVVLMVVALLIPLFWLKLTAVKGTFVLPQYTPFILLAFILINQYLKLIQIQKYMQARHKAA